MKNVKQFYKELGHLLYAVAIADGKIQNKEIKTLREFVSRELALSESSSDSSGMNQAFYVDFEFDDYANHKINMQEAHDSFIKFLEANITEIDPKLIEKSIEAIEKVASSFRNVNKQERKIVDKIKKEIAETADLF
jgi:uncharacterized tellurite resistance protein B-like protein